MVGVTDGIAVGVPVPPGEGVTDGVTVSVGDGIAVFVAVGETRMATK